MIYCYKEVYQKENSENKENLIKWLIKKYDQNEILFNENNFFCKEGNYLENEYYKMTNTSFLCQQAITCFFQSPAHFEYQQEIRMKHSLHGQFYIRLQQLHLWPVFQFGHKQMD